jgi:hypothetical protein
MLLTRYDAHDRADGSPDLGFERRATLASPSAENARGVSMPGPPFSRKKSRSEIRLIAEQATFLNLCQL